MVDPGFSKGGGGGGGVHKIMDACCLCEHTFLITKTKEWEVVKNSASPKGLFFCCCFMPFVLFQFNYNK